MPVFTNNPSGLIYSQDSNGVNLQVPADQNFIYCVVGDSALKTCTWNAVSEEVWFHSWIELIPAGRPNALLVNLPDGNSGMVTIPTTTPAAGSTTSPIPTTTPVPSNGAIEWNPLVCVGNCRLSKGSIAIIRQRGYDNVYGAIFETITVSSAYPDNKIVSNVECSNGSLLVTYKLLCNASLSPFTTTPGP